MQKRSCIFFDFDGVIVDSFDAAVKISENLKITGSAEEYRRLFDGSIAKHLNEEIPERTIRTFFQRYSEKLSGMAVVPGIISEIKELSKAYPNLAIVSSSYSSTIQKFLKMHELSDCFKEIRGFDAGDSKSQKIVELLSIFDTGNEDAVMITDTRGDIEESHSVGVKCIGVLWGYHDKETLGKAEPEALARFPKELPKLVASLLKKDEH